MGLGRRSDRVGLMSASDRNRRLAVTVAEVFCVLGTLVGLGVLGGPEVQQAAGGALAADATYIAPAVPAFGIWTPIYLGLAAYTLWQWLPVTATPRYRQTGWLAAASMVLNALWLLVVRAGWLWVSVHGGTSAASWVACRLAVGQRSGHHRAGADARGAAPAAGRPPTDLRSRARPDRCDVRPLSGLGLGGDLRQYRRHPRRRRCRARSADGRDHHDRGPGGHGRAGLCVCRAPRPYGRLTDRPESVAVGVAAALAAAGVLAVTLAQRSASSRSARHA